LVERRLPKPKVAGSRPVVRFLESRGNAMFSSRLAGTVTSAGNVPGDDLVSEPARLADAVLTNRPAGDLGVPSLIAPILLSMSLFECLPLNRGCARRETPGGRMRPSESLPQPGATATDSRCALGSTNGDAPSPLQDRDPRRRHRLEKRCARPRTPTPTRSECRHRDRAMRPVVDVNSDRADGAPLTALVSEPRA
jgi:hypothetical protein